jgi:hypothetical protein
MYYICVVLDDDGHIYYVIHCASGEGAASRRMQYTCVVLDDDGIHIGCVVYNVGCRAFFGNVHLIFLDSAAYFSKKDDFHLADHGATVYT